MSGGARIDMRPLLKVVRQYEKRARRVFREIGPLAAESMHAEVLEVFETEGYGQWPPFAWQRRGEPPPGTPMGQRVGPVTPARHARQMKEHARKEREKAAKRAEARKQKRLRAAFGHALGSVERRYGRPASPTRNRKKKRKRKASTQRYYDRMQGNPKLLQDTGNLVGSITPDWTDNVIEAYTNVPYAKYHISPAPRHVIPLRDFFDIDMARFEADVVDMILTRVDQPQAAE